jgi:SAM-dependent MidA family methyltransferase
LRAAQQGHLPDASWHDDLSTLPSDVALLVVANEFFDALPIRQLVRAGARWHERLLACQDTLFLPIAGPQVPDELIPEHLRDAAHGAVLETSPAGVAIMRDLAARLAAQGGGALVVDYGYTGPAIGDTLQAVRGHAFVNPFGNPGEHDLTAHVDFGTLAAAAAHEGAQVFGPVDQGRFLRSLGIGARASRLAASSPQRAQTIRAGHDRLVSTDAMGTLFKVLGLAAAGWPAPAGFA